MDGKPLPAIFGIGDSLVYFVDTYSRRDTWTRRGFVKLERPEQVPDKASWPWTTSPTTWRKGTMGRWASFYKQTFGFEEVRYFDIRGAGRVDLVRAALALRALLHPHQRGRRKEIADQSTWMNTRARASSTWPSPPATSGLLRRKLEGSPIEMLDMDDAYYAEGVRAGSQRHRGQGELRHAATCWWTVTRRGAPRFLPRISLAPIVIELIGARITAPSGGLRRPLPQYRA